MSLITPKRLQEFEATFSKNFNMSLSYGISEVKETVAHYEARISELVGLLGEQERELRRLRPPTPKFKVGQVVVYDNASNAPVRITSVDTNQGRVVYNGIYFEEGFRALTAEEYASAIVE